MTQQKMADDANFKSIYNKVGDLFRDIKMIDPNARNTIKADNGDGVGVQVSVGNIYEDAGRLIPIMDKGRPLSPTTFNKSYSGLLNAKTAIIEYLNQQQQQPQQQQPQQQLQQQPQQAAGRRNKRRNSKRRQSKKRRNTKRRRSSRK
jgi:hypothetical protein